MPATQGSSVGECISPRFRRPPHESLPFQITLSENVQRVVELSQRIVVEKSVIQTIEEVRNNTKTTEISIENSKRVVLSDNNKSESSTLYEKSKEISRETNGGPKESEKLMNGTEFSSESTKTEKPDDEQIEKIEIPLLVEENEPKIENADVTIPYNIVNNYFSVGVVS